jgi:hypothetical protein
MKHKPNASLFVILIATTALLFATADQAKAQEVHPVEEAQVVHPREEAQADGTVPGYQPITGRGRFNWFAYNTIGPQSLGTGLFSAGYGTGIDSPKEYGPHWEGFGKRYGLRLTGVSSSNAIEASLGSLWGEDPRYFRAAGQPFKNRIGHVIKMTLLAENRNSRTMPAYSRYVAIPANNFLSNTWRPDSNAHASDALLRSVMGVLGRMASNAFMEFSPDIRNLAVRDKQHP